MSEDELKLALKHAKRDERHLSNAETRYWCDQYKLLATQAIEALAQPEQEPLSKLQEPTAERAWFSIAELNAWADKKLSENPHWVMPKDEPERDEPQPQRTWVGLTDDEIEQMGLSNYIKVVRETEAKLKEKNK